MQGEPKEQTLMERKPALTMKISVVCALLNMKKGMNGSNVLASDGFMKTALLMLLRTQTGSQGCVLIA